MTPNGEFAVVWQTALGQGRPVDGADRFDELTVSSSWTGPGRSGRQLLAGDGSFAVVWEVGARDLRLRRFDVRGQETFGEIAVNAAPLGAQLLGDVAATPGWGSDVVWTDDRNENRIGQIRARTFLMDGTEGLAEFTVNPRGGGELRPRVAVDGPFRRYVVWEDDEDRNGKFQIHARGVDRFEEAFLRTLRVNPAWPGQQRRPAVATG